MCMATELAEAARNMQGRTKVNRNDVRRIAEIAKKCGQGKATGQEIAWAKRQAKGFLPRAR